MRSVGLISAITLSTRSIDPSCVYLSFIASRHDASGVAWTRFRRETFVPAHFVMHCYAAPVPVAPSMPPLDLLGVAAVATGVDIVYLPSKDSLGR
jgi:hypothetical protein